LETFSSYIVIIIFIVCKEWARSGKVFVTIHPLNLSKTAEHVWVNFRMFALNVVLQIFSCGVLQSELLPQTKLYQFFFSRVYIKGIIGSTCCNFLKVLF
jgi:hypothetical protein